MGYRRLRLASRRSESVPRFFIKKGGRSTSSVMRRANFALSIAYRAEAFTSRPFTAACTFLKTPIWQSTANGSRIVSRECGRFSGEINLPARSAENGTPFDVCFLQPKSTSKSNPPNRTFVHHSVCPFFAKFFSSLRGSLHRRNGRGKNGSSSRLIYTRAETTRRPTPMVINSGCFSPRPLWVPFALPQLVLFVPPAPL